MYNELSLAPSVVYVHVRMKRTEVAFDSTKIGEGNCAFSNRGRKEVAAAAAAAAAKEEFAKGRLTLSLYKEEMYTHMTEPTDIRTMRIALLSKKRRRNYSVR